jgi:hypothetical protein
MNGLLLFHLNLDFSSIERSKHNSVIKACYYPLLDLAENYQVKISVELSGKTLERIHSIDKDFIKKFATLINKGLIEIIGSGYVQAIGPIFPHEINTWNLKEGQNTYQKILGVKPKAALIGEMALSHSLIDIYIEAGFKTIIMDIDNVAESSKIKKKQLYRYRKIQSFHSNKDIKIIWSDSIMFQKFQRYIHGDLSINDYLSFLNRVMKKNMSHYLPIYSNDAEIFNYRPGRFETEAQIAEDEWKKIFSLLQNLQSNLGLKFKTSSSLSAIKNFKYKEKLFALKSLKKFTTAPYPVPVKKQKKYNINRWAVTGRDDQLLNTVSYRILQAMKDNIVPITQKNIRFLLENSASDLRTHITETRWKEHLEKLNSFIKKYKIHSSLKEINKADYQDLHEDLSNSLFSITKVEDQYLEIKTAHLKLRLNARKGLSIASLGFRSHKYKPYLQSFQNDFFDSIEYGADFFSGNMLLEVPSQMKRFTDLKDHSVQYHFNDKSLKFLIESPSSFFTLQKVIEINLLSQKITIGYVFKKIKLFSGILRVGNFLFSSKGIHSKLKIRSKIGGKEFETFKMGEDSFDHAAAVSQFVSSDRGIPATSGVIEISDFKDEGIKFSMKHENSFSMPMLKYQKIQPKPFLRLIFSLREIDDTSKPSKNIEPFYVEISPIAKD